ncbi:hypothetical protein OAV62_01945 [bacterium]|nr:hypothetical protein [bacterium]
MKIRLKNFGCWKDETFEFIDTGINLLSAPSGFGKTTVLRAIVFVLYGTGRKVAREGTTRCSVELWYKDLHIIRSKGPCRLLVNTDLEDDEAQSVINDKIGDISMLYLEQNGRNTFVNMTPQQKLQYMEKLTFSHYDLGGLKLRLKSKMKTVETTMLGMDTRIHLCKERLSGLVITPLPKEISRKFIETTQKTPDLVLSELTSQRLDLVHEIEQCDIQVKRITEYEKLSSEFTSAQNSLLQSKAETQKTISKYSSVLQDLTQSYDTNREEHLTELKTHVRLFKRLDRITKELTTQQELYDTMTQTECADLEERLSAAQSQLSEFPYKRKEVKKRLRLARERDSHRADRCEVVEQRKQFDRATLTADIQSQTQRLSSLSNEITEYELCKKRYDCPSCKVSLRMVDAHLVCVTGISYDPAHMESMKTNYSEIEKSLRTFVGELHELDQLDRLYARKGEMIQEITVEESVEELEDMYEKMSGLKRDVVDLTNSRGTIVEKFRLIEETIPPLQSLYDELTLKCGVITRPSQDIDAIEKELGQLSTQRLRINEYEGLLIDVRKVHASTEDRLEVLEQSFEEQLFDKTLDEYTHRISELHPRQNALTTRIEQLYLIKTYLHSKQEESILKAECRTYEEELKELKKIFKKCTEFKALLAKAEGIAIQSTIDTLNTHAQLFLDGFFVDDPISARILSTKGKGTRKEKYQMHIEVIYKGINIEPSMLSGGEYDRLVLGFMLAICETNNSPLVLLDECISSLDQESAEQVCFFLKSHHQTRCSILIAHQIILGMFDNVVDLTKIDK